MHNDKAIDASLRVAARILDIQIEHYDELKALGMDGVEAIFQAHTPLFSIINSSRTRIKELFGPEELKYFDEMIDTLKIDTGAH